jgi:predicted Rossmann fold flavoprotein
VEQLSYDLVVIGGGPAGLMAAGQAANNGVRVLLLEKMEKPARKLRITGKGRCNITNTKGWNEFAEHIHPNARFFKAAFYNFPNTSVIDFFEKNGLPLTVERGNRVYPSSQDAWDVASTLVKWAKQQGVEIRCNTEVIRLKQSGNQIETIVAKQNDSDISVSANAFIIATGGLSYPATGSTGDGFRFAAETEHIITPLRPSLVGIDVENPYPSLKGLILWNVKLSLLIDGSISDEAFGELQFNETGIEGPAMLRLSRKTVDAFMAEKKVALAVNLKPAVLTSQLRQRLFKDIAEGRKEGITMGALLRNYMPAQLVQAFAAGVGLHINKPVSDLRQAAVDKILHLLQCWEMPVSGVQGYERAVITAGGVSLDDIDHKTMRSRKIENLFFAGEVIDLDADTGGYNLQIAFSTGYLAGKMAAACCYISTSH